MLRTIRPILILIVVIWIVEGVNYVTGRALNHGLGLVPRDMGGLIGIVTMPVLHGGLAHAAANTIPLIILGGVALAVAPDRFGLATVAIVGVTGFAVWLLARPGTIHVGASGLVFGWFGYVIALGLIERSARALIGAAAVFLFYGSIIWGALPQTGMAISWEAHLFGGLAGALIAYILRKPG
ncbi:MAG: rhomboid family intramembrane serine protease [Pseudomonadota bacterium]